MSVRSHVKDVSADLEPVCNAWASLPVVHTTAVMGSIVVDAVERAEKWVPDLSTVSGRKLEADLIQLESSDT